MRASQKPRYTLKVLFVLKCSTSQAIFKNPFQHYSRVIMTQGLYSGFKDVVEPHFLDFSQWCVGTANRSSRDSSMCLWSVRKFSRIQVPYKIGSSPEHRDDSLTVFRQNCQPISRSSLLPHGSWWSFLNSVHLGEEKKKKWAWAL